VSFLRTLRRAGIRRLGGHSAVRSDQEARNEQRRRFGWMRHDARTPREEQAAQVRRERRKASGGMTA
jgi:hypothetical protein